LSNWIEAVPFAEILALERLEMGSGIPHSLPLTPPLEEVITGYTL
jgi:hypothetical protein